jgi:2-iminoacetate synthase ThiH
MFSRQHAVDLWETNDLIALGREADAVRQRMHPDHVVTYTSATDEAFEVFFPAAASIMDRLQLLEELPSPAVVVRPAVDSRATGVEYLKTVALTRLWLRDVSHVQASWRTFGLKVAQVALRFGADDLGRFDATATEEDLRRLIRDAGFIPKHRDALFQAYSLA